jgi:hypothetical protein
MLNLHISDQLKRFERDKHRLFGLFVNDIGTRGSLGLARDRLTNIRLSWKGLPGPNTLAYFAFSSETKLVFYLNYNISRTSISV